MYELVGETFNFFNYKSVELMHCRPPCFHFKLAVKKNLILNDCIDSNTIK